MIFFSLKKHFLKLASIYHGNENAAYIYVQVSNWSIGAYIGHSVSKVPSSTRT